VAPNDSEGLATLLRAMAGGDRPAFAELYRITAPQLFGVALRMLQRRDWAEETVHDAYLRIWQRAGAYAPAKGTALGWLCAIVRNAALDRLRRQRRELPLDAAPEYEDLADEAPGPLDQLMATSDGQALARCLDTVEPESRQCLVLAYWEGLTHEELARRTGRPLGTVKSWIRRALVRLRDCLGE
jgi:RNA polymerase sigma-70 factor (ECF subfamily)